MKIEAGKLYRDYTGSIGKAKAEADRNWFSVCGWTVSDAGSGKSGVQRIVAEVTVTDVLPFELKIGGQYELDTGEVVTLARTQWSSFSVVKTFPFAFCINGCFYLVMRCGKALRYSEANSTDELRIVREHVPPTPIERLETLENDFSKLTSDDEHYEIYKRLAPIIADLKAGAKC